MEESRGASLNMDVTKFLGDNKEEIVAVLQGEREYNEFVLFKMLEEGVNVDITLIAQGGSVKAHRCVLSTVSPVFKAMFQHDMKEQISSTLASTIDIPDMTIEGLKLFLLVLYTINEHIIIVELPDGQACEEPQRLPLPWMFRAGIDKYFDEFLRALLKYEAFRLRLKSLLKNALGRNLTPENCGEYYDISLQFNDEFNDEDRISCIVREYIINNFEVVVQSAEFLSEMRRNPDGVYYIVKAVISSISKEARRNHIKPQSKKARPD